MYTHIENKHSGAVNDPISAIVAAIECSDDYSFIEYLKQVNSEMGQ